MRAMRPAASMAGAAWLLFVALAAALPGTPGPAEARPDDDAHATGPTSACAAPDRTPETACIDLAERLAVADVEPPLVGLRFDRPGEARWRTSGWSPARDKRGGSAWTRGRDAVVEVPVVRPRPRRLVLRVSQPGRAAGMPTQQLDVLWNGREIGSAELPSGAPRILRFDVPSELQWVGPNRLHLLPRYWTPDEPRDSAEDSRRGVLVSEIRIEARDPELPSRTPLARRDGQAVVQAPGSVVSFGVALPGAARLRGRLRLEGSAAAGARVTAALLGPGRASRELASWDASQLTDGAEGAGGAAVDLPLGLEAGELAVLSLAFSWPRSRAISGRGRPRLRWEGLRIEGTQPPPTRATPVPARPQRPVNVLLVLFDTLRADHTEPYGAEHVETPHLRELAERGVTFLDATANASWTRTSVASLLSSLTPIAHGVTRLRSALPPELPYLPEILQRAGYTTIGVVNSPQITRAGGFERGFDTVVDRKSLSRPEEGGPEAHARSVWERHVEPALRADRPFFVYLHEIDPHAPYVPPEPFDTLYGFGYQGNVSSQGNGIDEQLRVLRLLQDGRRWLDEADIRHLRSLYAGEVTYMDRYLGWILQHLETRRPRSPTLLIFVSDHGEEFLEHGAWGHGANVHQTTLEVPLILSLPGVLPEGRRVRGPAQLHDVPATVLDLLGLERPPTLGGRSLVPLALGADAAWLDRPVFFHSMPKPNPKTALTREEHGLRFRHWKLVRRTVSRAARGGRTWDYSLYDLARDPGERLDLWSTEPAAAAALRHMLARYERSSGPVAGSDAPEAAPDAETERALRALGYVE